MGRLRDALGASVRRHRARGANATSWDKLQARDIEDTTAQRDVYNDQQLDRAEQGRLKTNTVAQATGVVVGLLVVLSVWVVWSVLVYGLSQLGGTGTAEQQGGSYYVSQTTADADGSPTTCYQPLRQDGTEDYGQPCYESAEAVPVPDWYEAEPRPETEAEETTGPKYAVVGDSLGEVTWMKLLWSAGAGGIAAAFIIEAGAKRVRKHNVKINHADINDYRDDAHIALPEEVARKFNPVPDAGAHFSVEASAMISHAMVQAKGLKTVQVTRRHTKDVRDENGEVTIHAGEPVIGSDGRPETVTEPIIDTEFGEALFDTSGVPDSPSIRRRFDLRRIPYNPDGSNREKFGKYDTVADLVNDDWELPEYERQRPAGVYWVDSAPVNTMVIAMTRAGKGQTYIEPMIDIWTREKNPSNMVINDPKGELLVKFYVTMALRGFHPVQFNLINVAKTDIYNPLMLAAQAAREGDSTKCDMYVGNIADVFFPVDDSEDPVWPNAANNAFKRAAYGLIEYYLEEEHAMRRSAEEAGTDPVVLEQQLDEMWGHATLYNCYQLFVQMTSVKLPNPLKDLERRHKAGEWRFDGPDAEQQQADFKAAEEEANRKAFLWEDQESLDMLTLYFNATKALPLNSMRTLVGNADNALRSMSGADKMMASVYGIAITAMSFFSTPTISTLTSGRPSQNVDLGSLSFPRRFGVRFDPGYMERYRLAGLQGVWSAYADPEFKQDLGPDFTHSDMVGRDGWTRSYFKGILETDTAWVKLELRNAQTGLPVKSFRFRFTKGYQTTVNGLHYVTETVTGQKVVKDGVLVELRERADGSWRPGSTTYRAQKLRYLSDEPGSKPERVEADVRAITQTSVRYCEKPKSIFLVTPPHLTSYAKLILILIKQMVDLNFDQSYMTKANQKPLLRTRFMLDELGNLQSDGHGIAAFQTMLSIGLGQEQQFTLILQTLQQLRDVYGDSVDKILLGNVSDIIFLKSTDDTLLEELEKLGGKTHRTRAKSKSLSENLDKAIGDKTEGAVSHTWETVEEPLISFNDLLHLSQRQSVVYRAGDAPVWNRRETILPMSWRMTTSQANTLRHPGHDYSLQTIPTLSTASEFDVRTNQPDFTAMLERRMRQAVAVEQAKKDYAVLHGYSDRDIKRLDPDVYADEIMELINTALDEADGEAEFAAQAARMGLDDLEAEMGMLAGLEPEPNTEVIEATRRAEAEQDERTRKRYAEGQVGREDLVGRGGGVNTSLEREIIDAYLSCQRHMENDTRHFRVGGDGELRGVDGTLFISYDPAGQRIRDAARDAGSSVWDEDGAVPRNERLRFALRVEPAFYRWLAAQDTWEGIARGYFDREMAKLMRDGMPASV